MAIKKKTCYEVHLKFWRPPDDSGGDMYIADIDPAHATMGIFIVLRWIEKMNAEGWLLHSTTGIYPK